VATETTETKQPSQALQVGLSMIGGSGITIMVVAAAIGVIGAENANSDQIGLWMALGTAMLIGAIIAWAAVVRPFANFDDINEPQYHGHHHEEDHDSGEEH